MHCNVLIQAKYCTCGAGIMLTPANYDTYVSYISIAIRAATATSPSRAFRTRLSHYPPVGCIEQTIHWPRPLPQSTQSTHSTNSAIATAYASPGHSPHPHNTSSSATVPNSGAQPHGKVPPSNINNFTLRMVMMPAQPLRQFMLHTCHLRI